MHVAASPDGLGEELAYGPLEPRVIIRLDELHAVEATGLEALHERCPARLRLAGGEVHAEHLAPVLPIYPERNEHRLGLDHPVEPDFFIARIQDHLRIRLVEPALGEAP